MSEPDYDKIGEHYAQTNRESPTNFKCSNGHVLFSHGMKLNGDVELHCHTCSEQYIASWVRTNNHWEFLSVPFPVDPNKMITADDLPIPPLPPMDDE